MAVHLKVLQQKPSFKKMSNESKEMPENGSMLKEFFHNEVKDIY